MRFFNSNDSNSKFKPNQGYLDILTRNQTNCKEVKIPGVNILQKEEDFVLGIVRVLQGRIPTNFDNLKKRKTIT